METIKYLQVCKSHLSSSELFIESKKQFLNNLLLLGISSVRCALLVNQ